MSHRRLLGCLPVLALLVCGWAGCKESDADKIAELTRRCEQLSKACGDTDKHIEKIVEECKQAAEKQVANSCADKVVAAYDCYEKELCGQDDKIWALDDFRVLSERHDKCAEEWMATKTCASK